jgi:hypothetical protein
MYNHAQLLSSGGEAGSETCNGLEQYAYDLFTRGKLRKRKGKSLPSTKNAVRGGSGSNGGYDGYIADLVWEAAPWVTIGAGERGTLLILGSSDYKEELWNARRAVPDSPLKDFLTNQALNAISVMCPQDTSDPTYASVDQGGDGRIEEGYAKFKQALGCLLSVAELASSTPTRGEDAESSRQFSSRLVHKATLIAEQGCKARIITVPPGGIYTLGDVIRRKMWPSVLKADKRVRPFLESVGSDGWMKDLRGSNIALGKGEGWASVDLTKATDGFYHDAVRAVLRGAERAGLGSGWRELAADSLGVGERVHYVVYNINDFPSDYHQEMLGAFESVRTGKVTKIYVPLRRGILMGTPLSFTVLSVINGWACKPLGPKTRICGDDVVSACKPPNITQYSNRVVSIGSGLHSGKSFYGTKGFTFCEVFGLGSGPVKFFNPYPLKQFQRDGYGVLDPGKAAKYDVVQWSSLRRVCKVLLKSVRAKARRLGRPPELTAALGGLGHPSKGMRDLPKPVRASLRTLVEDERVNPFRYVTRVDTFFAPVDGKSFRQARDTFDRVLCSNLGWYDEPVEECVFVPLRQLNACVAKRAHKLYWLNGGKYRPCEPKAMKPGKLRLPLPGPDLYHNKTPVQDVVQAFLRLKDTRGAWLSHQDALKIRGDKRTSYAGNSSSRGSRYEPAKS